MRGRTYSDAVRMAFDLPWNYFVFGGFEQCEFLAFFHHSRGVSIIYASFYENIRFVLGNRYASFWGL